MKQIKLLLEEIFITFIMFLFVVGIFYSINSILLEYAGLNIISYFQDIGKIFFNNYYIELYIYLFGVFLSFIISIILIILNINRYRSTFNRNLKKIGISYDIIKMNYSNGVYNFHYQDIYIFIKYIIIFLLFSWLSVFLFIIGTIIYIIKLIIRINRPKRLKELEYKLKNSIHSIKDIVKIKSETSTFEGNSTNNIRFYLTLEEYDEYSSNVNNYIHLNLLNQIYMALFFSLGIFKA